MIQMQKRILVAEDDFSVLRMMKFRLEHEGFAVFVAHDGEEALKEIDLDRPIDLILVDVKMPRLDGYAVCRRLKEHASTARIPIIIMSGTGSQLQNLSDRCVEVGADDWIQKPFLTKDLLVKIQKLLSGKNPNHGK